MPDLSSWAGIIGACWLLVEALTRSWPAAKAHAEQLPIVFAPALAAAAKASELGWAEVSWPQLLLLGVFAGVGARISHEKIVRAFFRRSHDRGPPDQGEPPDRN